MFLHIAKTTLLDHVWQILYQNYPQGSISNFNLYQKQVKVLAKRYGAYVVNFNANANFQIETFLYLFLQRTDDFRF